jgi:hypothetical protein
MMEEISTPHGYAQRLFMWLAMSSFILTVQDVPSLKFLQLKGATQQKLHSISMLINKPVFFPLHKVLRQHDGVFLKKLYYA